MEIENKDKDKTEDPLTQSQTQQESNPQNSDINLDDIPKEAIIEILKKNRKDLKTVQNKLTIIEKKYVKTFQQKKQENKDRENFLKILERIFDKEPYKFEAKPAGENLIETLEELFGIREKTITQEINQKTHDLQQQKQDLEKQYQKKLDTSQNSMDLQNKQIVDNLKKMKQDLESNSSKLAKEIVELNDIISEKNQEIDNLKSIEEEFQQYKADILLKELQKNKQRANNDISSRMKESEKKDNQIKLKNDLEEAHYQITKRDQQIEEYKALIQQKNMFPFFNKNIISNYPLKASHIQKKSTMKKSSTQIIDKPQTRTIMIQTDFATIKPLLRTQSQEIEDQKEEHIPYHKQDHPQQSMIQLGEHDINFDTHPNEDLTNNFKRQDHTLSQEYLKNVILKYFVYQESRNYRQANILMNAIITILRMTPLERQKIETARNQGSLWTSAKTWLTWSKYEEIDFPKSGSGGGL